MFSYVCVTFSGKQYMFSFVIMKEAALNAIGIIKEYLDDSVMRNMVLPRAKALYHKGSNVRVRIAGGRNFSRYMFQTLLLSALNDYVADVSNSLLDTVPVNGRQV